MINQGARSVWVSVRVCVCMHVCVCVEMYLCVSMCANRVNGGLASKRQGNEWSHSVCGPLASAVERRGS